MLSAISFQRSANNHKCTLAMFESQGFQRTRQLGKTHRVVTRMIGNQA